MEFMEDYEFDIARADLLERNKRFAEAAELHFSEGRIVKAISLLLKDPDVASRKRAQTCLLDGLWKSLPFGVSMRFRDEHVVVDTFLKELLQVSEQFLATPGVSEHTSDQVRSSWSISLRLD